jgi:hypothetical protein
MCRGRYVCFTGSNWRMKKKKKTANEELHYLYFSPDIIEVVTSRRMRWVEHEAQMGEDCIQCSARKPEAKKETT